jgi:hypothetical protein
MITVLKNETNEIPTTTFRGWIKNLDFHRLDITSKNVIERALPGFFSPLSLQPADGKVMTAYGVRPTPGERFRRYSGDGTLSSGRYYTLCQDSTGDDKATLCYEMMAYSNVASGIFVELIDSCLKIKEAEEYRAYLRNQGIDDRQPFLALSTSEFVDIDKDNSEVVLGNQVTQIMPINLTLADMHRVVDLRIPDIQDWFFKTFYELEIHYGRSPQREMQCWIVRELASFYDLIPTLLDPAQGGSTFHQAIGAWLRTNGVNALIYPSARRDVHISTRGYDVLSFDGWNMVVYEGSGEANYKNSFGLQASWLHEDHIGHITWEERSNSRKWSVSGIVATQRQKWQDEITNLERHYREKGSAKRGRTTISN